MTRTGFIPNQKMKIGISLFIHNQQDNSYDFRKIYS